ncbi:MAG: GNAT family N-acetyltransferase [Acidobacteria bacterium]|nr:MAG: GNAT family N-acetyltransferase [Acidobacteriota bacterium]
MALVVPATGALLQQILDETFPLWGEGLDRAGYERYNAAQLGTPWGASQLHRVALVEGSDWLATAKVYRLRGRFEGQEVPIVGLGAVFTPARRRRRGYAAQLIREVLAAAAADDCRLAVLFSEIPPSYYQQFGFRTVPVNQFLLGPGTYSRDRPGIKGGRAPGIALRSGEPRDLRAVAEMNAMQAEGFRFTLLRDPGYIAYAQAKKRLLAACGRPGHRQVEFFVVEEGGRAAGYAVVLEVGEYWMVTECGDRDPSGARVGAIVEAMLARFGPGKPGG